MTNLINLTEAYFRGKSKIQINNEILDFCKEYDFQERDVRTIINKIQDPKKKQGIPSLKAKVKKRYLNNQKVIKSITPIRELPPKKKWEIEYEELRLKSKNIPTDSLSYLEIKILKITAGMSRTKAYKWWGKFRNEITPRDFRKLIQKHIPLSKRFYECQALQLPPVVKPPKYVGKKKLQFLAGLRTSKSRKCNITRFIKIKENEQRQKQI